MDRQICAFRKGPRRRAAALATMLSAKLALMAIFSSPSLADEPQRGDDPLLIDAELADVCFVNAKLGWAVGDRGVIWHSRDGGHTWKMQDSHVRCRLNSVCFLDEANGWAAGGSTQPYTHLTQGALVHTSDGGQTWSAWPVALPTVARIKFFDKRRGVALGQVSALLPSGALTSDDGGHTWTPIPAEAGQPWIAGDFIDQSTGALAGHAGALALVVRKQIIPLRDGGSSLRTLNRMQLVAPSGGWLVGDGGLVSTTADLGKNWQPVAGAIANETSDCFDLSALAVVGPHCWVAGAPGSRVFRSSDQGKTWKSFSTGSLVPIRGLSFADAKNGWAVGALGTILATRDGGQTWQRQRSVATRTALAGFYSEPEQVPLELFTQLSAADGYLGIVHIVGRRDLDQPTPALANLAQRTHETLVATGACGADMAWRFPLRQAGLQASADQLIAALDRANNGHGLDQLERDFVRQLRTWRPDVVFTHRASPQGDDPLSYLIHQVVLQAVERAADPASYTELANEADLQPWQVKKVYAAARRNETGATSLNTLRLEPRLGCSIADQAAAAVGILVERYEPSPTEIGFQLLIDHIPQQRGQKDFFSGIALVPGGEARRMLGDPLIEAIEELRRATQKQRNMQELIRRSQGDSLASVAWQGQLADLTRDMRPDHAARSLYQLASQYQSGGHWELAAATFEALVARHPQHPLAYAAQEWLILYYSSGEVAWRLRQQSGVVVQQVSAEGTGDGTRVIPAGGTPALASRTVQGNVGDVDKAFGERRAKAADLGKTLERAQTALWAEPRVQFPLIAAARESGATEQADRALLALRRNRPHDDWSLAAHSELWLAQRAGSAPKPVWRVGATRDKPRLDGQLQEPFWERAKRIELTSTLKDDGDWPAAARMVCDGQFLYLGVECRQAPGTKYPPSEATRTRDADLSARDRVELLIDLDRDYVTYYRLVIDHRGWTSESCWNDASWNPTWYVAARSDDGGWTVEAAIPLAELTGTPPVAGQAWAVGLQRIVPAAGFQSWTQPAGTAIVPVGFGLLLFE